MKVGLSGTPLDSHCRKNYDGISVYTESVYRGLTNFGGVEVIPFVYEKSSLSYADVVGSSYVLTFAKSLLQQHPLSVDLCHFTDYKIFRTTCPSVATVHDAIPLSHPEWVSSRYRRIKNILLRYAVNQADAVIAVSHHAVRELVEYFGIDERRIFVVPCSIDDNWLALRPLDGGIVSKYCIPTDYFLVVGTFQPRKNLINTIQAFFTLPKEIRDEHPLVIVGKPGWKSDKEMAMIAEKKKLWPHQVYWLSNVSCREDLYQIYRHAFALVFASLYEGFGIPILEGYACRIPVITSAVSSMPEVAGDGAILVNPYQVYEIAEAMKTLHFLQNKERETLIANGASQLTQYSSSMVTQLLVSTYTSILQG